MGIGRRGGQGSSHNGNKIVYLSKKKGYVGSIQPIRYCICIENMGGQFRSFFFFFWIGNNLENKFSSNE